MNVGNMQDDIYPADVQEFEDSMIASLVSPSPQSRRFHYHPEYNYQKGKNPNARGDWLDVYITGEKKDFVRDTFKKFLAEEMGKDANHGSS
jgi:hypothetical protein